MCLSEAVPAALAAKSRPSPAGCRPHPAYRGAGKEAAGAWWEHPLPCERVVGAPHPLCQGRRYLPMPILMVGRPYQTRPADDGEEQADAVSRPTWLRVLRRKPTAWCRTRCTNHEAAAHRAGWLLVPPWIHRTGSAGAFCPDPPVTGLPPRATPATHRGQRRIRGDEGFLERAVPWVAVS